MATRGEFSSSPSKENESPFDPDKSPTRSDSVARGLAWQRRPNSQASDRSRSRPLSVVAAERAARTSTPSEPASATETISRDQIASALSAKDPAWFRQTADRGANSAAYRREQVEDDHRADPSSARAQLPGMLRTPSTEPPREDVEPQSDPPAPRNKLAPPISLSSTPKLDPPSTASQPDMEIEKAKQNVMGPPSDRTSPTRAERPVSPTKGMGGFVQSAMMKRSDSVSKRWSVQSPTGLQRGNRGSVDFSSQTGILTRPRPGSISRDPSAGPSSRPTSSQGREAASGEEQLSVDTKGPFKPETKGYFDSVEQGREVTSPPVSPSKTMDPRRWSPTKSSWLESALNKPESPKLKSTQTTPNQPAWMVEIQKAKAQKAADPSTERSRSPTVSHKHQVSIGGLMRSSAPGVTAKPAPLGGLQSPVTPTMAGPNLAAGFNRSSSQTSSTVTDEKAAIETTDGHDTTSPSTAEKPKPEVKPKPDTPPVKDFRASLKSRQTPSTSTGNAPAAEFKNVFGNLRKTTAQSYKPPDELKDNIMKGKAALNNTGGPQKPERKDEFKEAILARKKSFHQVQSEGRGVTRNNSAASETPVPEGLVKRIELQRTGTWKRDSAAVDGVTIDPKRSSVASKPDLVENASDKPERASLHKKKDSTLDSLKAKLTDEPSTKPGFQGETNAPGRLPGRLAGGALANRFNPALAGLLARGPPGSSGSGSAPRSNSQSDDSARDIGTEAGSGRKLTHMTKNRARGPKRTAPTSVSAIGAANESDSRPASQISAEPKAASVKREFSPATSPKSRPLNATVENEEEIPNRKPSPTKESAPSTRIHEQVAAFAASKRQPSPTKENSEPEQVESRPSSPKKLDTKRMSRFLDESNPPTEKSAEPQTQEGKRVSIPPPSVRPKPSFDKPSSPGVPKTQPQPNPLNRSPKSAGLEELPRKTVSSTGTEESVPAAPIRNGTAPFGSRPLPTTPKNTRPNSARSDARPLPLEPQQSPRPLPNHNPKSPATSPPLRSPKQLQDEPVNLEDFFGPDRPKRNYHADAAEILMKRPTASIAKIQTLNSQLFQFSADGKKIPVPSHRERTLFEREMYLCVHTFNNEAGKKTTEVYFWAGDEVPQSAAEDASIFVSRETRAVGGQLVKLQQNKETPEFLQALGGIVITQRGSGNKYDSLAPHMLCGRRHLGHVVFDEVDFTPSSLCSGFPYVITQAGRCYLWKGKGSGVDELSCARLIGMDFALSGEMEEIEDGHESSNFWNLFDGGSKSASADHWRLKPSYDKYCGRLFYSDAASRQQVSYTACRRFKCCAILD